MPIFSPYIHHIHQPITGQTTTRDTSHALRLALLVLQGLGQLQDTCRAKETFQLLGAKWNTQRIYRILVIYSIYYMLYELYELYVIYYVTCYMLDIIYIYCIVCYICLDVKYVNIVYDNICYVLYMFTLDILI